MTKSKKQTLFQILPSFWIEKFQIKPTKCAKSPRHEEIQAIYILNQTNEAAQAH